jgi:hypothetical protein
MRVTSPRVWQLAFLGLALVVAAFAATWLTLPNDDDARVSVPASFFARGLTTAEHHPLPFMRTTSSPDRAIVSLTTAGPVSGGQVRSRLRRAERR